MKKIDPKYLKHKECNLCGADDTVKLVTIDKVYDNNKYNIVKCKKCGLIYSDPRPMLSKMEVGKFIYNKEYYKNEMPYNGQSKYITRIFRTSCEEQASIIERYVSKGRFLEIGCGTGMFMEIMQRRGWQVWGTEVSTYAVESCKRKGLRVLNTDLRGLDFPPGYFNCIMLGQVIEHLSDPSSIIKKVWELCAKGGLVVVSTENAEGLSSKIETFIRGPLQTEIGKAVIKKFFGRYPRGFYGRISPPVHLFYFSEKTLSLILRKHGFKIIRIIKVSRGNKTYYPEIERYRCNVRELAFKLIDDIAGIVGKGEVLVLYAAKK